MEIERYIIADDVTLVDATLEGDHLAFEALTMRYREAIYRMMLARTGSAYDADDLIQETLIKVFINLPRYDKSFTFGQWIYTIARNTLIDSHRRRHDDFSLDDRFSVTDLKSPTPEQSVINSQERKLIDEAIERLSETHAKLFKMRFLDEYSYEEIAEKLQMPLGSVKTNIHRARAKMCQYLLEGDK
ncbi:MAG: RNA polymerase sigma factor [Rikenellaceae bacterium]